MSSLAAELGEASDIEELPILEDSFGEPNGVPIEEKNSQRTDSDLEDDKENVGKDIEGSECKVKNVYEGPKECECHINWVDEYPDNWKPKIAADETSESKKHAILVRNKRSHVGPKAFEIHSIVIQSPILKSLLHDIIGTYPGITFEAKEVVIASPFRPLFHNWDTLRAAIVNRGDEESKSYLKLLFRVLKPEMKSTIKPYRDLVSHSVITFDLLWTIFKPGDFVFETDPRMYQVIRISYRSTKETPTFELKCRYIDWDGDKFGYDTTTKSISAFQGPVAIKELSICPKTYVEDLEKMEQTLVDRGKRFQSLCGCQYKAYKGNALSPRSWNSFYAGQAPIFIDGRVVIDANAYFQYNPDTEISLSNLEPSLNTDKPIQPRGALSDKELMICAPYVRGYSLKQKKWVQLQVNKVSDISWNDGAFKSLILPRQYKNLLFSIVQSKLEQGCAFDDVIERKGKGVILLLSGDPGVGKTLTAESVAEEMRRPLYTVTAGELGSQVDKVENSLGKVLELAARWNAVLLLDEADVFLEQRSNHEIERNMLVSIFLRTFEYYTGILFITTNRQSSIDKAFRSRIDLSLDYPSLTVTSQIEIWKGFIARTSSCLEEFTDEDWASFTKQPMNGREIKNAVKLAHLLAAGNKTTLAPKHVKEVLEALHGNLWEEYQELLNGK